MDWIGCFLEQGVNFIQADLLDGGRVPRGRVFSLGNQLCRYPRVQVVHALDVILGQVHFGVEGGLEGCRGALLDELEGGVDGSGAGLFCEQPVRLHGPCFDDGIGGVLLNSQPQTPHDLVQRGRHKDAVDGVHEGLQGKWLQVPGKLIQELVNDSRGGW